jgi:NitT/TauT family transport system ATP-binding protein
MPIKSILMVTHNIEEAVLMCDRILVLSSNPGRIAAEIKIPLHHPRNRLDPEFRQLVDLIYARMTQRADPKTRDGNFPGLGFGMILPRVSTNTLAGLLEALIVPPYNGKADLPHLAGTLQLEIDELFPAAETLQLLRFAEVEAGDIRVTPAGKKFAEGDVDTRKRLFADHLIAYVPLAARIRRVLDERPTHQAPADRFRQELEDHMSDKAAERTLNTVTTWSRYGELFAFDEAAQVFSLENPQ